MLQHNCFVFHCTPRKGNMSLLMQKRSKMTTACPIAPLYNQKQRLEHVLTYTIICMHIKYNASLPLRQQHTSSQQAVHQLHLWLSEP
jgi:hypothetical protein